MSDNYESLLTEYFPEQIYTLLKRSGEAAASGGQNLWLVGGVVRDLLLDRTNVDLDLVAEKDALALAQELSNATGAQLSTHPRFGTAKLSYAGFTIDLATARSERYEKPGALPAVAPGTIEDDLRRRDFSINAMAICVVPECFGDLVDHSNGRKDLTNSVIRVLHPNSFVDDATRILRALRYEQRLGFKLEAATEQMLRRDVEMLNTISGDRIRRELELILNEKAPELILRRVVDTGVLKALHPCLHFNAQLAGKFMQVRSKHAVSMRFPLYILFLIYHCTEQENEQIISRFNFSKQLSQIMRHTLQLKARLPELNSYDLKPGDIYHLLHKYSVHAVEANAIATGVPVICEHLQHYLTILRFVRPILKGTDLTAMGIQPGQQVGTALSRLQKAKLNGVVKTRRDEEQFIKRILPEL